MGDTPTSPGKDFAIATLSWLSPIRHPRLWKTLIGAILRSYGAGTPKSEHLLDGGPGSSGSPPKSVTRVATPDGGALPWG